MRNGNGEFLATMTHNTQVTTFETKWINGETFVRIGDNKYAAQRFLMACASAPVNPPTPSSSDKYVQTLEMIFGHEGQCQNWASDVGNTCQGKIGYTCMGITPCVAYGNRQFFGYASSFNGQPADFCKYAYDLNRAGFKQGSAEIYKKNYFYPCNSLAQPAFYVCADISVNSGPGKSQQYMKELNNCSGLSAKGM